MTNENEHGAEIEECQRTMERLADAVNTLNNLLTVMRGHAQLAYEDPSEKNVQDLIRVVLTSTGRAQRRMREVMGREGMAGLTSETLSAEPKKGKILVVDDEQLIRTLMRELLTKSGHAVTVAGDEGEALDACRRDLFDVVFLDIRLAEADGILTFRKIREMTPTTHVVFLSGDPNLDSIWQTVRNEGADGFIKKPFDITEIDNVVARLMSFPAVGGPEA